MEEEHSQKMKLSMKKPKHETCTSCKWKCTEHFADTDRNLLRAAYVGIESYKRQKDFLLSLIIKRKEQERTTGNTEQRQMPPVVVS